jgi:hypothetical protein
MTELADSFFTVDIYSFSSEQMTSVFGGQGLVISSLALAAAVDVLIAIGLTYLLVRTRTAVSGFAR